MVATKFDYNTVLKFCYGNKYKALARVTRSISTYRSCAHPICVSRLASLFEIQARLECELKHTGVAGVRGTAPENLELDLAQTKSGA